MARIARKITSKEAKAYDVLETIARRRKDSFGIIPLRIERMVQEDIGYNRTRYWSGYELLYGRVGRPYNDSVSKATLEETLPECVDLVNKINTKSLQIRDLVESLDKDRYELYEYLMTKVIDDRTLVDKPFTLMTPEEEAQYEIMKAQKQKETKDV